MLPGPGQGIGAFPEASRSVATSNTPKACQLRPSPDSPPPATPPPAENSPHPPTLPHTRQPDRTCRTVGFQESTHSATSGSVHFKLYHPTLATAYRFPASVPRLTISAPACVFTLTWIVFLFKQGIEKPFVAKFTITGHVELSIGLGLFSAVNETSRAAVATHESVILLV